VKAAFSLIESGMDEEEERRLAGPWPDEDEEAGSIVVNSLGGGRHTATFLFLAPLGVVA